LLSKYWKIYPKVRKFSQIYARKNSQNSHFFQKNNKKLWGEKENKIKINA
jgi:hypothetical protein